MKVSHLSISIFALFTLALSCSDNISNQMTENQKQYTFPEESEKHEGTWLQWPHHHQYGFQYRNSLDPTWVAMAAALSSGENVHIIAYDESEKSRIIDLLEDADVIMDRIDFYLYKTDDVWVRDNGPIFVRDEDGRLVIQDWGFNGWGEKLDEFSGEPIRFRHCDAIPSQIARDLDKEVLDLNAVMTNEGGSVVLDGRGTLMACKSSILNPNRNPGMSLSEAEKIFQQYLGASHFIWLEGQMGLDITDQHIDGFAVFGNSETIVTMNQQDLLEYDVLPSDIETLYSSRNKEGAAYDFLQVPLTQNTVRKTNGQDLGYRGSYINYYIANQVVLVPNYSDPNDSVANEIIQSLYPDRTVIGIDVRNLYENGGMVHCVTQQQPAE